MDSIVYAVPVTQKKPGETPIYRHPKAINGLWKPKIQTMQAIWMESLRKFSQRKCLDELTYAEVDNKASKLGSWLVENNHKLVYIHSKNRVEWILVDIACWKYGLINVPLYDTLGKQALNHTFQLTEGSVIFSSKETVQSLINNVTIQQSLKTIVLMDEIDISIIKNIQKKGLKIISFKQLISQTSRIIQPKKVNPSDVISYIFTSGTTGIPKGSIVLHINLATQLYCCQQILKFNQKDVLFSFFPLAHVHERTNIIYLIGHGGQVRFGSGNSADFLKDLRIIKPTYLPTVPRLLNMMYAILKPMKHVSQQIAQKAFQAKEESILNNTKCPSEYDNVFKPANDLIGGNVRILLTGSAPIATEVLTFFKIVLNADIVEGYGQTQTHCISTLTVPKDFTTGHVGGVTQSVELKLVDIPQMNYFSDSPQPTGEICYRGYSIFSGYYKNQKITKQTIDKDGWHHTGDVGKLLPNGALKVIDRKKNIYKLSQGEYVAPQKVQNIYKQNPIISDVFLYGDSLQNYNIAIIIPNIEILQNYGIKGTIQQICQNQQAYKIVKKSIEQSARKAKLFGFQQAKKIFLYPNTFQSIGIVTNTMKLQRHQAKIFFKDIITKIYSSS